MKLVVCIVHNRDRNKICEDLIRGGFKFTVIGSTGGFLREGNTTMLFGIDEKEVPALEEIIARNCKAREQFLNVTPFDSTAPVIIASPIKVQVGGAIFFVLNVEKFGRY